MELILVTFWIAVVCVVMVLALPWIGVVMVRYFDWVRSITKK